MANGDEEDRSSMVASKKYKLFSPASSDSGVAGPCAFFASPAGCRNGDKCQFLHVLPDASPAVVQQRFTGSSPVISSESEDDVVTLPPAPALTFSTPTVPSTPAQKKKNKTKKKRKSSDSGDGANGDDIFMKPKNHSVSKEATRMQHSNKKPKGEHTETSRQSSKVPNSPFLGSVGTFAAMADTPSSAKTPVMHHQPCQQSSKQVFGDFRCLQLPVASFSIDGEAQAAAAPRAVPEEKAPAPVTQPHLPLPKHTPIGLKWQKAILKTREHVRYSGSFDFDKMKEADEEAGRGYATDWITARKFGPWCASNPQAIAIDCEMCETMDPVTGSVDSKALCRVSVVDAETDEVLLDTLVKPAWPVVDYRSRINGIKEEHLTNVQFTLRHAQAFLMALCSDETVIIGHALHNDFAALKMEHHCNVDSSFLYPVQDAPNATPSLKDIALSVLKKAMPDTHDSVNDARTALLCLKTYLSENGEVTPIIRTLSRAPMQLFVHRIPKKCQPTHLATMFLTHTSIQPSEVDEIEFLGATGRTHVTFPSSRHADLAFDTLGGKEEADKSGRMQKKVYLQGGGYVRVRKMVYPRLPKQQESPNEES